MAVRRSPCFLAMPPAQTQAKTRIEILFLARSFPTQSDRLSNGADSAEKSTSPPNFATQTYDGALAKCLKFFVLTQLGGALRVKHLGANFETNSPGFFRPRLGEPRKTRGKKAVISPLD